jgi:Phage derived protein Gp49-like (DUF891)
LDGQTEARLRAVLRSPGNFTPASGQILPPPLPGDVERHRLRDINKPLDSGLFELITTHKKLEFRCIYAFHHPEIVVLLCFVKKSGKTPPKLLAEARKRNLHVLRKEVTLGNATLH